MKLGLPFSVAVAIPASQPSYHTGRRRDRRVKIQARSPRNNSRLSPQWSYDLLNRQTAKTYADATHDDYGYDAVGNLITQTNAAGQVAVNTYDVRDRLTQTVWSGGSAPTVTRSYDLAGRLATLDNGNAAEGYAYDAANQLLAETNFIGSATFTTRYGYDLDGRRQMLVYPSGNVLTNSYTARSQVKAIYANGPPPLATFSYDANGNRLTKDLNNGVNTSYTYDHANRVTGIASANGLATVSSFAYTYNAVNNRTSASREDGRVENYGYDAAQQLTGVTYGDATGEGFNYDLMGNLQSRTGVAPVTMTVNNLNQYTAVNGNATSFDAKGNLLSWTGGAFGYDAQNRLIGASRGTNGVIFEYDGRNRAVQRTINGTTTTYIYDGWDLIAEYQGAMPVAEYLHGPGVDEMLARATALGTFYYTGDALNSTATLTDNSGAVVERYRYTAFGQPTVYDATGTNALTSSSYGNRFAFQGREWFAELNLTDHRNRYYSPELNRWPNSDPIGIDGGLNLYGYVGNNPVNAIDPYGLKSCCKDSDKVSIWICNRRLGGQHGSWPRIGPLSHSFVACKDPKTTDPKDIPAFGKQPRPVSEPGSAFRGPGYIDREQYWEEPGDFAHCREKKVCPEDRDRMCQTGPTESPYCLFGKNCHSWANGRSN